VDDDGIARLHAGLAKSIQQFLMGQHINSFR
jgi:hypothetical protein